jgi:predicted peptidase
MKIFGDFRKNFFHLILLLGLTQALTTQAEQTPDARFLENHMSVEINGQNVDVPYRVFLPDGYTGDHNWPMILALHGVGEQGSDGVAPTQVGLGHALRESSSRFPFIVVLPQAPKGQYWEGNLAEATLSMLEQTREKYNGDSTRLYLTGYSMGGYGTFYLASLYPDLFAAAVPICGGGDPATMAPRLLGLPLWIFHGSDDDVVPVEESRSMVRALQAEMHPNLRYTEYPNTTHDSWDKAYAEPDLVKWLLSFHR